MLKYFLFLGLLIIEAPLHGQNFPDSIYMAKDSPIVGKILQKDFKKYICMKAKEIFKDKDLNSYKRYVLSRAGRMSVVNGFSLYYTDSFYIRVEVRGNLIMTPGGKPMDWYFRKLKRKKVIIMEIPLHLVVRE